MLRDLPALGQETILDYEEEDPSVPKNFGKSYLKNTYGTDFIRLEIDENRYKHNKTRRLGGIHHIPLKVHGYAETSEFPVSTDTERPVKTPSSFHHQRPKKQASSGPNADKAASPFKGLMENIPGIHHLPNLMQSLVTNHASWMDKVWPSSEAEPATPKMVQ